MIKLYYKTKVKDFVDIIKVPNQLTLSLSKNKSKITLAGSDISDKSFKRNQEFLEEEILME